MSLQEIINPPEEPRPPLEAAAAKEPKSPMRSWRKKFRKLKLRFERAMDDSNAMYMNEHKQVALARRLQEENDNLLEILLDLNERPEVPETYALCLPGDDKLALDTRLRAFPQHQEELHDLTSLLADVPHTEMYPGIPVPEDVAGDRPPGYFDTTYEEEYLTNLDAQLPEEEALLAPAVVGEDGSGDSTAPPSLPAIRPPVSRHVPSEKELMTSNPNSVISWLRRHHPETFIQEKDTNPPPPAPPPPPPQQQQQQHGPSERPPRVRGSGAGAGKRASLASATVSTPGPKTEQDLEDDGATTTTGAGMSHRLFPDEMPAAERKPTARGKKGSRANQDDDGAYRPKGGSSGRTGTKRKRNADADGDTPKGGARGKRAKAAAAAAAAASTAAASAAAD